MPPVRIGFIGAGIFVRDAYVPNILDLGDTFHVTAICSRTLESAQERAAQLPYPVDTMTDPDALIARDDIDAVFVLLPIEVMPEIVAKVLAAGKALISEKPIAPTVAIGRDLIAQARPGQLWMVAENYRYEEAFVKAGQLVADGAIGKPLLANLTMRIPINPDNKYFHTEWRRNPQFPGGWLMDSGVHWIAGIRMVLGEVAQASAFATLTRPQLPPYDTLASVLHFENGTLANYSSTHATNVEYGMSMNVIGQDGVIEMTRESLRLFSAGAEAAQDVEVKGMRSIRDELAAFAESFLTGAPNRNTPEEALRDVAVMEAILQSVESGQAVPVKRI